MPGSHLGIPRNETVISKQNYNVLSPCSYNHISVRDLYIFPGSVCLYSAAGNTVCGPMLGIYKSLTRHMNVEIGTEAAKFSEKEYINRIFVEV